MIPQQVLEERPVPRNPLHRRLLDVTGGAAYLPVLLLFSLWLFDQFDTAAFNVLAPDIKRSFHLTDHPLVERLLEAVHDWTVPA